MKINNKILCQYILIIISLLLVFKANATSPDILNNSNQLLVVITPHANAVRGVMMRYHRDDSDSPWVKVGDSIPTVVGANGTALGIDYRNSGIPGPVKVEGDNRTPIGIYRLGPAFGFESKPRFVKLKYLPIRPQVVCVDDSDSKYYNQILNASELTDADFESSEKMSTISVYKLGGVIQFNAKHRIQNAGSCIFLHIWDDANTGTEGCVATSEAHIYEIMHWLDPDQQPAIAIFTKPIYDKFQAKWDLPPLE